MADIERLGITFVEDAPLTVCDYDADDNGNPTWVVAEGVAHFDPDREGLADRLQDGRPALGASGGLRLRWASVRECPLSGSVLGVEHGDVRDADDRALRRL
jgi:hypothetical protein